MNVGDDLYLGNFEGTQGLCLQTTGQENPTAQIGVGPMGRIAFYNAIPLTIQTANVAVLQAQTANVPLVLAAGTGATLGTAPDGSGLPVIKFDVPRGVSLTSGSNLSAGKVLVTGYDQYGQKMTQLMTNASTNTVTSLKAFASILSAVPDTTSASTMSIGSSDLFGLPFYIADAGYIVSVKWNETLAPDAGTFVAGVATAPSTNLLGDVRGTYVPSANASNGTRRLVIAMHLTGAQCGSAPTIVGLLGQPQV